MNKIVCSICGTTYPDNAEKCPICGYAETVESVRTVTPAAVSYTHVKGGRFSKSNVKKRNKNKQASNGRVSSSRRGRKKKTNIGAIIVIVVLLLAIITVLGYIALRFFIPNDFLYEGLGIFGTSQNSEVPATDPVDDPGTEPTDDTTPSLECTGVQLQQTEIALDAIGSTFNLSVTLEPAETPDQVLYSSSDERVATVSEDGVITAVGEGNAVITVTCGSVSAACNVSCTIPEPEIEFTLNRKEITFSEEGQSWLLYDGEIPSNEITWSSDDNNVATITDGKVVAVGEGVATVSGIYKEQTVSCAIICKFEENSEAESGNITEAEGDEDGSGKTYQLYNPYGRADDVTIRTGDEFTLMLVDENKDEATNVQWSVDDENVCTFNDNVVTGVNSGMTEVTATFKGKTYTCIVRVY